MRIFENYFGATSLGIAVEAVEAGNILFKNQNYIPESYS
jgi:hypothetical protein